MIIQPFSFLQQVTTLAAPPAVTPTIRFDANSASISLALPFNYFAGSFGMGSIISDVSANVRGTGTNLPVNWTGSGAYWATSSFVNSTGSGYFESISTTGQRYPAWPGNATEFNFGTGNVTIEGYVNLSAANFFFNPWNHPLSLTITWQSTGNFWRVVVESATFQQQVVDAASTLTAGQWYHFAFTRRGSGTNNCAFWINGVRIMNFTNNFTLGSNVTYPVQINQQNIGGAFARMQDFRVYKGASTYNPANATMTPSGSIVNNT
jgi:hypothetical protein